MQSGTHIVPIQRSKPHAPSLLRRSIVQRQCPICNRFRCLLKSHQAFARHLNGQQQNARFHQIHDEKPDPFAKHPIEMTTELERFYAQGFSRWNSEFKGPERHLFPSSRYRAIFRNAWNDEALHYGVLSVVATQISVLRNGVVDRSALELQLKTITLQSQFLARGEMSDARVMTALCIMSNAFATNKGEDLSAHLRLIMAWLQRRGGLQHLGMEGIIADNLMYADHTRAIMHNQKPHHHVRLPAIPSQTAPRAGNAFLHLQQRGLISEEVALAASNYMVLVKIFDKAAKGRGTPSEATYFAYLANVVEYQLACENSDHRDTNTLNECVVLACLVNNHTLLRNYGNISPSLPEIEKRLWRCLDYLRDSQFFEMHRVFDLEYYLVCIGAITSVRRTSPFEDRAGRIIVHLRQRNNGPVQTFHELCDILEKYGWSESVCLTLYARIWNKSTEAQLIKKEPHY